MRISPKRVLFNKLWLYTFLLNVSIVYYYYAKFPLMKFPLIMYPITATMSIVNPMWHWLVPDGLKKGLSSSFSYLHYIPNLAVGYRTKYEGKLITMEHGSFSKKIGVSVEPLSEISQKTASDTYSISTLDSFSQFCRATLDNLQNYVMSFAVTQSQMTPDNNAAFIPMSSFANWVSNFERKLQHNPNFWKK